MPTMEPLHGQIDHCVCSGSFLGRLLSCVLKGQPFVIVVIFSFVRLSVTDVLWLNDAR